MMTSATGWKKYILISYDAAVKSKLDLMEVGSTAGRSSDVVETGLKTQEKSSIDQCIAPVTPVKTPKISVKLPNNLVKDGGVLLSILKNYPKIEIAGTPGNIVSVDGLKLGKITRIIKQMYSQTSRKPHKNVTKILEILLSGLPTRQQFVGTKNLRVWRKLQSLKAKKRR